MNYESAVGLVQGLQKELPNVLENAQIARPFDNRPAIGNWNNENNIGMPVHGDGIGNQSGVYLFCDGRGDILYIGKATTDNLHQRAWDHVRTPVLGENGWREFPNHTFARNCPEGQALASGQVFLRLIVVSPREVVSLIEVYLQTVCAVREGRLPVFNNQIG